MRIAVLRERAAGERRVALVPDTVARLTADGHQVSIERGAGEEAGFPDEEFAAANAQIVSDALAALREADLLPVIHAPPAEAISALRRGAALFGLLRPGAAPDLLESLAAQGVSAFSMELVPRIARAQRLDVLSSQSSLAGYKAVLMAADTLGKILPMMMTAAGTIPPSRVLVLGAGVAGLQAIATARRLGAMVEAFDVRPAVREQVESLGAAFVEVPEVGAVETAGGYAGELGEEQQARQRAAIAERAEAADIVITTALIPGRPAPLLITESAVRAMRPGSVIVDLAAEAGGNCELSEPGETVTRHGVVIHAPRNVPALLPLHASVMYSRNVAALIELLSDESGALSFDFSDEVVRATCVTHDGRVVFGNQDSLQATSSTPSPTGRGLG